MVRVSVTAHGGGGQAACGRPDQPVRPGDQQCARHRRGCDDREVPGADQWERTQRGGQVRNVDHRQGGQRHRTHRARGGVGGLRRGQGVRTGGHGGVSCLGFLSGDRVAPGRPSACGTL